MRLIVKQRVNSFVQTNVIRVMSYNIRMAPCVEDDATENAWTYRLPKIIMIFDEYMPDIIGVQEISLYQTNTLKDNLHHVAYKFLSKYPTKKPIESGLGIVYNPRKILLRVEGLYLFA